jgi:hypothetical protein
MHSQNEIRTYVLHKQPMARSTKEALKRIAKRKGLTLRAMFRQFINKTLHEAED